MRGLIAAIAIVGLATTAEAQQYASPIYNGITLRSLNGFVQANGTGPATAVGTTGTGNVVLATGGSIDLTNATGLPLGGLVGLGSGVQSLLSGTPTGTGGLVGKSAPSISALTVTGSFTATGLVTNADLANSATTVNGQTCPLGSTCTVTAAASSVAVGTTLVTAGTAKNLFYNNAGVLGEVATGNNGVLVTNGTGVPSISTTLPTGLALQTPASVNLTNGTALPISGIAGLGTGVGTALAQPLSGSGSLLAATPSALSGVFFNSAGSVATAPAGTLAVSLWGASTALADNVSYINSAVQSGKPVFLPPGTWLVCSPVVMSTSGGALYGPGTLKACPTFSGGQLITLAANGLTVSGLTLDGGSHPTAIFNAFSNTQALVNTTLVNNSILNFPGSGIYLTSNSGAWTNLNATFKDNYFGNLAGSAILAGRLVSATVENNTIVSTGYSAVQFSDNSSGIHVTNNKMNKASPPYRMLLTLTSNGASTTSIAVGTGSKTFTVPSGIAGWTATPSRFLVVYETSNPANYMWGTITSYTGTTLVLNVTASGGSGTHTDWTISTEEGFFIVTDNTGNDFIITGNKLYDNRHAFADAIGAAPENAGGTATNRNYVINSNLIEFAGLFGIDAGTYSEVCDNVIQYPANAGIVVESDTGGTTTTTNICNNNILNVGNTTYTQQAGIVLVADTRAGTDTVGNIKVSGNIVRDDRSPQYTYYGMQIGTQNVVWSGPVSVNDNDFSAVANQSVKVSNLGAYPTVFSYVGNTMLNPAYAIASPGTWFNWPIGYQQVNLTNASATNLQAIKGGFVGQHIVVWFGDGNTTWQPDSANALGFGADRTVGNSNSTYTAQIGDSLICDKGPASWMCQLVKR